MGPADTGHQRSYERRARRKQDQEGHAGPVSEYQPNGTRQHREAAGGYGGAVSLVITVPGVGRRVPGTGIVRLGHRASSAGRCTHASGAGCRKASGGRGSHSFHRSQPRCPGASPYLLGTRGHLLGTRGRPVNPPRRPAVLRTPREALHGRIWSRDPATGGYPREAWSGLLLGPAPSCRTHDVIEGLAAIRRSPGA